MVPVYPYEDRRTRFSRCIIALTAEKKKLHSSPHKTNFPIVFHSRQNGYSRGKSVLKGRKLIDHTPSTFLALLFCEKNFLYDGLAHQGEFECLRVRRGVHPGLPSGFTFMTTMVPYIWRTASPAFAHKVRPRPFHSLGLQFWACFSTTSLHYNFDRLPESGVRGSRWKDAGLGRAARHVPLTGMVMKSGGSWRGRPQMCAHDALG